MIKVLIYALQSAMSASLAGFLFWMIVKELQAGDIEMASIGFAVLIFGVFLKLSIQHDNIKDQITEQ